MKPFQLQVLPTIQTPKIQAICMILINGRIDFKVANYKNGNTGITVFVPDSASYDFIVSTMFKMIEGYNQ